MGNSITSRNVSRGFAPQSDIDVFAGANMGLSMDTHPMSDTFGLTHRTYPLQRKDQLEFMRDLVGDKIWGIYRVAPNDFHLKLKQRAAFLGAQDRRRGLPLTPLSEYDFISRSSKADRDHFTIQPVFTVASCLFCTRQGQGALANCKTYQFLDGLDTIEALIAKDVERSMTMNASIQTISDFQLQCCVANLVYIIDVNNLTPTYRPYSPNLGDVQEAIMCLQFFSGRDDMVGSFKFYSYERGNHGVTVTRIHGVPHARVQHAIVLKC